MVYDVNMRRVDAIPTLIGNRVSGGETQNGIHAIQINPSRTLLATGARHSSDIAVYRLPTLDPVCIGEQGHRDWVMDMCWLDDQFIVSGSKDAKMALWRISDDILDGEDDAGEEKCPTYAHISALAVKECRAAQKIRSLCFNPDYKEIAVISLNGYIHIFNAETFSQVIFNMPSHLTDSITHHLFINHFVDFIFLAYRNCHENYQIAKTTFALPANLRAYTRSGVVRIHCCLIREHYRCVHITWSLRETISKRSFFFRLQAVKKIASRYSGCGIRSASFQDNMLTVGTGIGMLMFYDVRAGKYLESSINSSRTVVLKASKGYVVCRTSRELPWGDRTTH